MMLRTLTRSFYSSSKKLIQYVGSTLEAIARDNGADGYQWSVVTGNVCNEIQKADPRIKIARIQGPRAHQPGIDPKDKKQVVTVGLGNNRKMRIGTIHVHLDGTWKFWASRAGKRLGYEKNITNAAIRGMLNDENDQETPDGSQ